MTLFDDLFIRELTNDFTSFPILITIGIAILLSKAWLVVARATKVETTAVNFILIPAEESKL